MTAPDGVKTSFDGEQAQFALTLAYLVLDSDQAPLPVGRSLREVLDMSRECYDSGGWKQARERLRMGEQLLEQARGRRPRIDLQYWAGVLYYFYAATYLGEGQPALALETFANAQAHFRPLNGMGAATWLIMARVYDARQDYADGLGALDKCETSLQRLPTSLAGALREHVQAEYRRVRELLGGVVPPRSPSQTDVAMVDEPSYADESSWTKKTAPTQTEPNPLAYQPGPTETSPSGAARRPSRSTRGKARLVSLPVIRTLAAGSGLWLGDDDPNQTFAEIEEVYIDNALYRIVPIEDDGAAVSLDRNYYVGLVAVDGESMNRAGLKTGDFALFRAPIASPYAPVAGHIVAAAYEDKNGDRKGVIKRYRLQRGKEYLVSESDDPACEDIQVWDKWVEYVGRVIAVLKKQDA